MRVVVFATARRRANVVVMTQPDWAAIFDVTWKILAALAVPIGAFIHKRPDAFALLLQSIPNLFDAVVQEQRRGTNPLALKDPQARALELAQAQLGRALSSAQTAAVVNALRAHNERLRAVKAAVTPIVPVVPMATTPEVPPNAAPAGSAMASKPLASGALGGAKPFP